MPLEIRDLAEHPNPLASSYRSFRVSERLLLTGHSHQAWPDCSQEGQLRAWQDAAQQVDQKWDLAFEQAQRVAEGFARLLGDPGGEIVLGANTHELVVRWLSALPLRERPRLVTSDGEFHSIRRQLARLEEEGIEVVRVPAAEPHMLGARLASEVDDRTAAVLVSKVLFQSGRIVPGLADVAEASARHGAELLIDVYHALGVMPFSLAEEGLESAFAVGGGYKYCQLGEGNCFLRLPSQCDMRPVITGWFAEFGNLSAPPGGGVAYGQGALRFAGATYDPTSHYRAAEVFAFFEREQLAPERLRALSQHQVGLLATAFDELDLDPAEISRNRQVPMSEMGGFLVLETTQAEALCAQLRARGLYTDSRGSSLRLGPAPYLSDPQLHEAIGILGEAVRA